MKLFLRVLKVMVFSTLLTLLTQVGGLIYLLYQPLGELVRQKVKPGWRQKGYRRGNACKAP